VTPGTTLQPPLNFLMHADPDEEEGNGVVGEELASELSKTELSEISVKVPVRMPGVVFLTKDVIKNDITQHRRV